MGESRENTTDEYGAENDERGIVLPGLVKANMEIARAAFTDGTSNTLSAEAREILGDPARAEDYVERAVRMEKGIPPTQWLAGLTKTENSAPSSNAQLPQEQTRGHVGAGRPPDAVYDKAFKMTQDGASFGDAYKFVCEEKGWETYDSANRLRVRSALHRRRR